MKHLMRGIAFGVTLLLAAGVAKAVNLPAVGTKLDGSVQVGIYTIPLPQGQWTVIQSLQKNKSRKVDTKKSLTGHMGVLSVVLAQSHVNQLGGVVIIETNADYEPENFSDSAHSHDAGRQFYKEEFYTSSSARGKQSHISVGPHILCAKDCQGLLRNYINENNLVHPKSALVDVSIMLARHGGFALVQYLINPEVDGVTLDPNMAKAGLWHPDERDDLHVVQREYLEKTTHWAQEMKERLLHVHG